MATMSRILGVLGGMGPAATVGFLAQLQALTPAQGDAHHIRVLMDMNPQVPDRNRTPELAEAVLAEMAQRLKTAGAEVLAMPCNTAHAQAAGIRAAGLPFIDMIAETTQAVAASGARRVGVLATPGGEVLYVAAFQAAGLTPVLLEGPDREAFMARIYGVKAGETGEAARSRMKALAAGLVARGADGLVAGCTEVPLLLAQADVSAPLTDSSEVLARACVAACR
jgi:aspartate racemase